MGPLWSLEIKTKALTCSVKMLSSEGGFSSCSGMCLAGFNGGGIDNPQNGYWARATNFLLPSFLPMLTYVGWFHSAH